MAKTTMFERSHTKVRFSNEDMDYLFQVVLGYHTTAGPASVSSSVQLPRWRTAIQVVGSPPSERWGRGSSVRQRNWRRRARRAPRQLSCAPSDD